MENIKGVKYGLQHCADKNSDIAILYFPNGITDDELKKGLDEYYKHNQGVIAFEKIYLITKGKVRKI